VLDGGATIELADETVNIGPGDTVIIPTDIPRRLCADPAAGFAAIVVAPAGTRAYTIDVARVSRGCAVPDGTSSYRPGWSSRRGRRPPAPRQVAGCGLPPGLRGEATTEVILPGRA
jgi:hypothetical protein